jgi:hypothetical protein
LEEVIPITVASCWREYIGNDVTGNEMKFIPKQGLRALYDALGSNLEHMTTSLG